MSIYHQIGEPDVTNERMTHLLKLNRFFHSHDARIMTHDASRIQTWHRVYPAQENFTHSHNLQKIFTQFLRKFDGNFERISCEIKENFMQFSSKFHVIFKRIPPKFLREFHSIISNAGYTFIIFHISYTISCFLRKKMKCETFLTYFSPFSRNFDSKLCIRADLHKI